MGQALEVNRALLITDQQVEALDQQQRTLARQPAGRDVGIVVLPQDTVEATGADQARMVADSTPMFTNQSSCSA